MLRRMAGGETRSRIVVAEVDHEAQGSQRPAKVQGLDIVDDLESSNHRQAVEGQAQL